MDPVKFQLDDESKKRLETLVPPDKMRQAMYQIVKRTTTALSRIIQKKVRSESTISAKEVKRVITVVNPKGDPPVAEVIVTKKLLPLAAFKYSVSKSGGVTVTISKSLPKIQLQHAFVAKMDSGHVGIFQRARHLPTKGKNVGAKNKHGGPLYKLTPTGYAGRFAITESFGPSIYKIVSVPEVLKSINFDAAAELKKQAESQIYRFATHEPIVDQTDSSDE